MISGWTSIILLNNTTYKLEIKELISKMYLNQKDFVYNVKELSILLVKDANHRFNENKDDKNIYKNVNSQSLK